MACVKKVNCIVCPLSCLGEIIVKENGQIQAANGFSCQRGVKYGQEEITSPKRTLTTTVKVHGGELPLLPVVSKTPLPKNKVLACAHYLAGIRVKAPIAEGDIICTNILGLGVDIIATRDLALSCAS